MFLTFSSMILKFYINKRIIKFIHPLNFPFSSLKLILLYSLEGLTRYERNSQRKKRKKILQDPRNTTLSLSISLSFKFISSFTFPSFLSILRTNRKIGSRSRESWQKWRYPWRDKASESRISCPSL